MWQVQTDQTYVVVLPKTCPFLLILFFWHLFLTFGCNMLFLVYTLDDSSLPAHVEKVIALSSLLARHFERCIRCFYICACLLSCFFYMSFIFVLMCFCMIYVFTCHQPARNCRWKLACMVHLGHLHHGFKWSC